MGTTMGYGFSYLSVGRRATNGIVETNISDLDEGTAFRRLQPALRRHLLLFGSSNGEPLTVAEAAASCGIDAPTYAYDGSSAEGEAIAVDASQLLTIEPLTDGLIDFLWLLDSDVPWTSNRAATMATRFMGFDYVNMFEIDAHIGTTVCVIESGWFVQSRLPEMVDALIDDSVDQLVDYLRGRHNTRIALSRDKPRIDLDVDIPPASLHALLGSPDDWAINVVWGDADVDSVKLRLQVRLEAQPESEKPLDAVAGYVTPADAWTMTFVG